MNRRQWSSGGGKKDSIRWGEWSLLYARVVVNFRKATQSASSSDSPTQTNAINGGEQRSSCVDFSILCEVDNTRLIDVKD